MASGELVNWRWGYVVAFGRFFLNFVDGGIAKSFEILKALMADRFSKSYATIGLVCSFPSTLNFLATPVASFIMGKTSRRSTAVLGGLLTGLGMMACAYIRNILVLGVCTSLAGVGMSMVFLPTMLTINDYFSDRFVLILTLCMYGCTAGSMVLPFVTERSLEAYGYSGCFLILGAIALNLVVSGVALVKPRRVKEIESRDQQVPDQDGVVVITDQEHESETDEHATALTPVENSTTYSFGESRHVTTLLCSEHGETSSRIGAKVGDIEGESRVDDSPIHTTLEGKCVITGVDESRPLLKTLSFSEITCDDNGEKRSSGWLRKETYIVWWHESLWYQEPVFAGTLPLQFLGSHTIYAWMLFLIPHAEELGIESSRAVYLSSIGGIAGLLGRTLFVVLVAHRVDIFLIYTPVLVLCTATFLFDFVTSAFSGRAVLAFLQGFCFFIEDTMAGAITKATVVCDKNFASALAQTSFALGLGATTAGFFTGEY